MIRTRTIPAAFAAALMLSAPIAFAASATEHWRRPEHESQAAIDAFSNVKVSLQDAIGTAEQHSNGKAVNADFEVRRGKPFYRIETVRNDSVWVGRIDANSGQILGSGNTIPKAQLDREDHAELSALQNAKLSLQQAMQTAAQQNHGKPIFAELEARNGRTNYEVGVVNNGSLQRVTVDPQSGQITATQNEHEPARPNGAQPGARAGSRG